MQKRLVILVSTAIALLILLFAIDFFILANPAQIALQLQHQFREQLAADIEFSSISRRFFSTKVTVKDLRLTSTTGKKEQFLQAEQMELRLNPLSAFRGPPIKTIKLLHPVLTLIRDKNGKWNFPLTGRENVDDPFVSMVASPSDNPMPKIDLKGANIHIRDRNKPQKDANYYGLNLSIKKGGEAGERSLTMAYFFKNGDGESKHLQLTFTIPQDGNGMVIRTSGSNSSHIVLNDDIRKLLEHLSLSGSVFAQKALDNWNAFRAEGVIRVESLRLEQKFDETGEEMWSIKGKLFLDNCAISHKELPYRVENITGEIHIDENKIEFVSVSGNNAAGSGRFTLRGIINTREADKVSYKLTALLDRIDTDENLRKFIVRNEDIRDFWNSLEPRGMLNRCVINIDKNADSDEAQLSYELILRGGPIFTYRYEDAEGKIHPIDIKDIRGNIKVSDESVSLNLTARALGNKLEISNGILERPRQPDSRICVDIAVPSPQITDELMELLPTDFIEKLDEITLEKGAILVLKLRKEPEDNEMKIEPELRFKDATATFSLFPYLLENVNGSISLSNNVIEISDLSARHGSGSLHVSGNILLKESGAECDIKITGNDITLDESLRSALPQDARKTWDMYVYRSESGTWNSGYADLEGTIKTIDGKVVPDITAQVRQGKGWLEAFPYLLTDVEGTLAIKDTAVLIDMKGRHGSAQFTVRDGIADWGFINIDVHAQGVEMERAFGDALQGNFRTAYESLNPRGSVDIVVHVRERPGDKEIQVSADVSSKETLCLLYDGLPLPVEAISTEFTITMKDLIVREFAGIIGGAKVEKHKDNKGICKFGESTDFTLFIKEIEGLILHDYTIAALPKGLGKTLAAIKAKGALDIQNLKMHYYIDEGITLYDFSLDIICRDISMGEKAVIDKLNGKITINATDKGQGQMSIAGKVEDFKFTVLGINVKKVNGDISCIEPGKDGADNESNNHLFAFVATMRCRDDKSNLLGSFIFNLGQGGGYKGEIKLLGADIKQMLTDLGQDAEDVEGLLSGHMEFSGNAEGGKKMTGTGWMRFTEAKLMKLPIILRLKGLLKGSPPGSQFINRGKAQFDIRDSALYLTKIIMKSNAVTIAGNGRIDFNGDMNITLYSDTILEDIPVVDDLMRFLNKKIYAVTITGKFAEPKISPASLKKRVETLPKDLLDMLKDLPGLKVEDD